jgi:transposase-like protein
MLREAAPDITAFAPFPVDHWRRIWSTNPLERLIKEVKRRCEVVGIFADEAAILRLVGAVLIEAHSGWAISERRYLSEGSMAAILASQTPPAAGTTTPASPASQPKPMIPFTR